MDSAHVVQMVSYLKTMKQIHGVVIVLNAQEPRFSSSLQNMVKLFCHIFRAVNFADHVCLVFTHTFNITAEQIQKKKDLNNKKMQALFRSTGINANNTIPVFLIDCKTKQPDLELENIRTWLAQRQSLQTSLLQKADPNFEKIEEEEQTIKVNTTSSPIIETRTKTYTVQVPKQVWDGDLGKIFGNKKTVYHSETRSTNEQVQTGTLYTYYWEKQTRNKKTTYSEDVVYDPWKTIQQWTTTQKG